MLSEKIEGELAVIIRHLLTRFASQTKLNDYCMNSRNQRRH